MRIKVTSILFFLTISSFAQQIENGFASGLNINDFKQPLKSGIYEINSLGINPDESHSWQHLFVMRHSNQSNNFQLQFSSSYNNNDRIFFRKIANNSNSVWNELATRGNNTFEGNQIVNGNVGIGITNPNAKLEVSNTINSDQNEVIASLTRFGTGTGGSSIVRFGYHNTVDFEINSGYTNSGHRFGSYFDLNIINNRAGGDNGGINFVTNSTIKMAVNVNGNVGIGVNIPRNKLDVNGTIHSKEVKVDMNDWSDFVFKKDYNLPTLEEVEKHITEKGHLENIPSEEEVLKNGINLGEMNAKLLQKIEELTLYSIQQNKKIEDQKKEIEILKELVIRVSKIETKLAEKSQN